MHVGIACGGTGGHVVPGITVARILSARGRRTTAWLTGRGVEAASVHGWQGPVVSVGSTGFSGGLSWRAVGAVLGMAVATVACRRRMKADRPDVLLAMGGYACVGPVLAARALRVPVVLHEANAVPGRAVSALAPLAAAVAVAFDDAAGRVRHRLVRVTGMPVRQDLNLRFGPGEIAEGRFTVLVAGGSQGARFLDRTVAEALCRAYGRVTNLQVIHLARPEHAREVEDRYQQAGVPNRVFGFLREIGKAYGAASLAIARAGAATCAELAACAVPALLIPYPHAQRNHQAANAGTLAAVGACDVARESECPADRVAAYVEECARTPEKLAAMRDACRRTTLPDTGDRLADLVEQTATR